MNIATRAQIIRIVFALYSTVVGVILLRNLYFVIKPVAKVMSSPVPTINVTEMNTIQGILTKREVLPEATTSAVTQTVFGKAEPFGK